jgi:hypothetical protein
MSVIYMIPDFEDEDGIRYTEIEVIVTCDGDDIREAAKLAERATGDLN